MADLSGLDVGWKIRKEKKLIEEGDEDEEDSETVKQRNELGTRVTDEGVGGGVGSGKVAKQRYSRIGDILYNSGRLGVKNTKGFYRYEAQRGHSRAVPVPDKVVEEVIMKEIERKRLNNHRDGNSMNNRNNINNVSNISDINSTMNITSFSDSPSRGTYGMTDKRATDEYIVQRLLFPVINEAFKLLGEGGVPSGRPGDVDIIFVKGNY